MTDRQFEVIVHGAGPAGKNAADVAVRRSPSDQSRAFSDQLAATDDQ